MERVAHCLQADDTVSKTSPLKKKRSTNKPQSVDIAPTMKSESKGLVKKMPFYVMALGNFGTASWPLWLITQSRGDLAIVNAIFCLIGSAIFLVSSASTALFGWRFGNSKGYVFLLLFGLILTLIPWIILYQFIK